MRPEHDVFIYRSLSRATTRLHPKLVLSVDRDGEFLRPPVEGIKSTERGVFLGLLRPRKDTLARGNLAFA